ncbi:META domain-containing protein [Flavivirga eckloniae]|uniref:DUF306 domain-containing protein n=1 Tax=Flavivirga eckloniae TaxID=1803846 RepID=A0A2K9PR68_9FLAO|nr:hypothetical protein [Flavivirga eckloniae]AUP79077.1 hypothetical protein C1H87_10345 [Flavivirga eckloniae]
MRHLRHLLAFCTVIFFISSCNNDDDTPSQNGLIGDWLVVKVMNKKGNSTIYNAYTIENATATISFRNDGVVEFRSCNKGEGYFEDNDNNISISKLFITELNCPFNETIISSNLSGEYLIDGNTLKITSNLDADLILTRTDLD